MLGALSIVTNCGVLYLSSPQISIRGVMLKDMEWLMVFVFLEHILLGIRFLLHITISDKPEWVRVALARRNYESKQALKILKIEVKLRNAKCVRPYIIVEFFIFSRNYNVIENCSRENSRQFTEHTAINKIMDTDCENLVTVVI